MTIAFLIAVLFNIPANTSKLTIQIPVAEAAALDYSPAAVREFASTTASEYGLNITHFLDVLQYEDGFENGQSTIPDPAGPNGLEDSWGDCQIHLPAHKSISKEQATDPYWCIPWMAQMWANGYANQWSAWTHFQKIGWPDK